MPAKSADDAVSDEEAPPDAAVQAKSADDAMAAVYANVCLRALLWFCPGWIA